MVICGIAHREGEYNGQKYNNYMLHCLRNADEGKGEIGQISEVLKVSSSVFEGLVGIDVGVNVLPLYDKFGRIIDLNIS